MGSLRYIKLNTVYTREIEKNTEYLSKISQQKIEELKKRLILFLKKDNLGDKCDQAKYCFLYLKILFEHKKNIQELIGYLELGKVKKLKKHTEVWGTYKMLYRGTNIGYLRFEGNVNQKKVTQEIFSHSKIHKKAKNKALRVLQNNPSNSNNQDKILDTLSKYAVNDNTILPSYYVSKDNTIFFTEEKKANIYREEMENLKNVLERTNIRTSLKKELKEFISNKNPYDRRNDSESKMLNAFLSDKMNAEINGEITIFTQYSPCLSCEKQISYFSKKYPQLDITVVFTKEYGI